MGGIIIKEFYNRNKEIIDRVLKYFVLFLVVYIFLKYFFNYVAPFVTAFILSLLLEPLVRFFNTKLKVSRGIGSFLSIMCFIGLIITFGTAVIYNLAREMKSLVTNIPVYEEQILQTYNNLKQQAENIFYLIPEDLSSAVGEIMDSLIASVISLLSSGVKTGSMGFVVKVPSAFMFIVITFMATFFLLKDKYEIEAILVKRMPISLTRTLKQIKVHVLGAMAGYFKAEFMLMCCVFIICVVVLSVIGSPYALLMALIISVIDALPVFGSGFVLWPWAAWSLVSGDYKFAIGLVVNYLIVLLTRQILEPKFVGEQIGIHPLVTLFAIYVGMKVFGVFGVILGPVIAVLIKALLKVEAQI